MKKILPLIFLLSLNLTSCKDNAAIPLFHNSGVIYSDEISTKYLTYSLSNDILKEYINKKASFFLLVYAPGCGTCDNLTPVINDYIKRNKAIFPYMLVGNYNDVREEIASLPEINSNSILFISNGVVKANVVLTQKYYDGKPFDKLMAKYVYDSHKYIKNTIYVDSFNTSFLPCYKISTFYHVENKEYIYSSILDTEQVLMINKDNITNYSDVISNINKKEVENVYFYNDNDQFIKDNFATLEDYQIVNFPRQ